MKAAWIALQRWNKQRVVKCSECGPLVYGQRVRAPLARQMAKAHAAQWERRSRYPHRVSVKRRG